MFLALLLLGAVGLRIAAVLVLESYHEPYTYEHGEIAENLLEGRGFRVTFLGVDGLTSQQAPLYPALLAGTYAGFGQQTDAAHLALQLLQCLAGGAIVYFVYSLAKSMTPDRPALAWLAACGAAVYPPHIYMVTHIQVVVWATLVLTWLAAGCFSRQRGGRGKPLGLGILSGALLLIDPILALALPFLAWTYWLRQRESVGQQAQEPRRLPLMSFRPLAGPTVMAAVAALVVAPWVMRNYRVHGEFVFVKSTFGYAFWQGNNAHSWGTDKIPKALDEQPVSDSLADINRHLAAARSETLYIDDVLLTPEDYQALAALSELNRSRLLGERAKTFIREHPGAYLALCLTRWRYFFWLDETNPKAMHPVYQASTAAWLGLLLIGLFTLRPQDRIAWLTIAIVLAIGLFHAATISSARFRLPIEPLCFPWCAAGAIWVLHASIALGKAFLSTVSGSASRSAPMRELPTG